MTARVQSPGMAPAPAVPGHAPRPGAGTAQPGPDGAVVYTIALPPRLKLLNSNEMRKMHWRTERAIARDIVDAAIVMTRAAKVPRLDRVVISAALHPNDRRKLDPHNWSPSVKAATDGIVRSGVLADDDFEHVTDGGITLGEPVKGFQLVLYVTPVGGAS